MALTKVQQELWAQSIIALFETSTVAGQLVNRNVIADTRADKWHITAASEVSVSDVSDGTDITYDDVTDTDTEVTVNFDKAFSLVDYDSNKVETSINYMPTYIRRGAYKLTDELDTDIFLDSYAAAGSDFDNGGTDWQFTKDTAAEIPAFFGKLSKAVKDLDWPESQPRYLVVPSGMKEAILTYTGGRESAMGDSELTAGRTDAFVYGGFNCFISNNLTTVSTTTHGLAGLVGDGIALGVQVDPNSMEMMRAEGRFADLYRGRMRAGHKVYRSAAVVDVEFNSTVVATS
jgi:hypothetical protein